MIVKDVQRGALQTCIWDVNSQHHPRQLSMAHQPALIEWDRQCTVSSRLPLFAFTSSPDQDRAAPCCGDDTYSVFLEMEPPDVSRVHPLAQPGLADKFDLVLSLEDATQYGVHASNVIQWPYGSSSIPVEHWNTSYPKHKLCSIIVSDKNFTEGHQLRHRVVAIIQSEFAGMCDVLGRGYRPIDSKLEGLRDYMFTIVIENSRHGMYMTEKLMDAVAVGVVPIYWGSTFATSLFEDAILPWDTLEDLRRILNHLSAALYDKMQPLLHRNLQMARHYVPPEQWLWENVMGCAYEWHLAHPPMHCGPRLRASTKLPASVLTSAG